MDLLQYRQLSPDDDVSGFDCGSAEWQRDVSDFLKDDALTQQALRLNKSFVFYDDARLVGYTSLVAWKLELKVDPQKLRAHPGIPEAADAGRIAYPALLIGQFGVALDQQGKGYGRLIASWVRMHALSLEIGVRFLALHVHRHNRPARDFWRSQGFQNSAAGGGSSMLFMWSDLLL